MSIHDFKALWAWCEQERNNDKFWRRFIAATAAYEPEVQARLVKFAHDLWFCCAGDSACDFGRNKMTNAKNTVVCLHLHDGTYLVGYLVKDDDGAVIIAPSIHPTAGTNYQQVTVRRDSIEQRYSIPIVWW